MNIRLRQETIMHNLPRNGSSTIDTLARDVGASRRTVLRDLSAPRDQGFVIHSEPGPGGDVHLDPRSVQTTARLTVPEVLALLIRGAVMRVAGKLPFSDLADAGLAKIEKARPSDKVRDLRRFLDCLPVGQISPRQDLSDVGTMDPALLSTFETAVLQELRLRVLCRDAKGHQTSRELEPQAMLILSPLWYLVAWDPTRADVRHVRIDRISAREPVEGATVLPRHVPFDADICPFPEFKR